MSEPKFTPGPWRVFNETGVGTGKVRVADCEDIEVGFGRGADKYNAALIAAAPEMYELLDELDKATTAAEIDALYARIPVLLKKARGEK